MTKAQSKPDKLGGCKAKFIFTTGRKSLENHKILFTPQGEIQFFL
jgi:hypothetical protein